MQSANTKQNTALQIREKKQLFKKSVNCFSCDLKNLFFKFLFLKSMFDVYAVKLLHIFDTSDREQTSSFATLRLHLPSRRSFIIFMLFQLRAL